jgi:hypothetical protein
MGKDRESWVSILSRRKHGFEPRRDRQTDPPLQVVTEFRSSARHFNSCNGFPFPWYYPFDLILKHLIILMNNEKYC